VKAYSIVGMNHTGKEEFVKTLPAGAPAILIREPNNPFDPRAVAVWIDAVKVGYIPKNQNTELAKRIDEFGEPTLALDAMSGPSGRSLPAKFIRSPNSGFPMVEV
jgi:hypothetical protein